MTEPTPPAHLYKLLSRKWQLSIDSSDGSADPTWVQVRGLNTLSLGIDPNEVDVSDFDSEGWSDSITTFRSWSVTANGFRGYTKDVGGVIILDPGQEIAVAAGLVTGDEAQKRIKLVHSDTQKGFTGTASVNYGGTGGDVKAVEPMNLSFTGSGALTQVDETVTP